MTAPHLSMIRRVAPQADGTTRFEFIATVTTAGTLPTKNLFVMQIQDPADPKNDIVARVATPRDLRQIDGSYYLKAQAATALTLSGDLFLRVANTTELASLAQDRATAVRQGESYYLTSVLARSYEALETADAAVRQVLDRLSALTTAWTTINTNFVTTPTAEYDLPVLESSIETLRRTAYTHAVTARQAAQVTLDAAQDALDACHTNCATDRTIHAMLVADVGFLERARARVAGLATSDARDFVLRAGSFASDVDSYDVLLASKRTQLDTYAARVLECANRCATLQTARDTAAADRDQALENERTALADVRAVCPTFTPSE